MTTTATSPTTTVAKISSDAATLAQISAAIAASFGTDSAIHQDATVLDDIASDISFDTSQPITVANLVQAVVDGSYGDQAAKLLLFQLGPSDAATVAAQQYDEKWTNKYSVLTSPQQIFDKMSADVWAGLTHAARSKPAGFLIDQEEWFEPVRRQMWVLAHRATAALLILKNPAWASQISNTDLVTAN